jgi:hypothetical protein
MGVYHDQYPPLHAHSHGNESLFIGIGLVIGDGDCVIVLENSFRLRKANSVFGEIEFGLTDIPLAGHVAFIICT